MNVRMLRRDAFHVVLGAFGITFSAFGMVEIVHPFLGVPFVAIGGIIVIASIRLRGSGSAPASWRWRCQWLSLKLGWSSEHLWNGPNCSHVGAISGQRGYWSGATLQWQCLNGRPVITKDTR